jgi:hypothetical protein
MLSRTAFGSRYAQLTSCDRRTHYRGAAVRVQPTRGVATVERGATDPCVRLQRKWVPAVYLNRNRS